MNKLTLLASIVLAASAAAAAVTIDKSDLFYPGDTSLSGDEITELAIKVADLEIRFAQLTNILNYIERKCEASAEWRREYHNGVGAQTLCTNEFGIVYSVTIYNDGYTYADYKTIARKARSKAEEEARQKELIEQKRGEIIDAMRKATLPDKVLRTIEMLKDTTQSASALVK